MYLELTVFRIRDIRGSGSGSGSCSFSPVRGDIKVFAQYFLKVHLHHSSQVKGHKEVTKQYLEIKGFLTIFA
jgi:hypothetical protein